LRVATALVLAAVFVGPAAASDLLDLNATDVQLRVNGKTALVEYRANGRERHVLVWGAINARSPNEDRRQVRFKRDYSGGLATQHRFVWKRFVDQCQPYDGPPLAYLLTACKAPDGSYWALQSWQRNLPHRGWEPWTDWQQAWELRLSHWTGDLAEVELYADWAFHGDAHGIFGRAIYAGFPVHGFHTTSSGNPVDGYGRNLYIDTYDSAYGPGWKRETSILFRKSSGAFCYSFWPTHDASLPGRPARPEGHGKRYRISVVGPGVTPDVTAEADGLPDFDVRNPDLVALERKMTVLFDEVIAGDKFCATQH
jgi:hypothetical protein